jgi:pimeloyl-ACP methyl ester carboxylesterase
MMRLLRLPSSVVRSRSPLLEEASVTKNGRHCTLLSSSRLYSSVATTNTAVTTTTTTTSNVADTTTTTVVELKYMDYLPHHDSSGKHSPIVFLHGLLGNKKNFATIATSLGNQLTKKRRIIGLDLRNHGTFYMINQYPSYLVSAIQ